MTCRLCYRTLPATGFYEREPGVLRAECKDCAKARVARARLARQAGQPLPRRPVTKISRTATPEERAVYLKDWRDERLAEARVVLGGGCAVCGAVEGLDFDHVDPANKVKEVTTILYTRNLAEFWAEVAKCQLLCRPHHNEKTRRERQHRGKVSS